MVWMRRVPMPSRSIWKLRRQLSARVTDLLGLGEEGGTIAPQGDASAAFLEEGGAQLLLQGGHGVAQAGLGDIQALGGAAVMHLLGEDEEVAEMVDVHGERNPLFGLV